MLLCVYYGLLYSDILIGGALCFVFGRCLIASLKHSNILTDDWQNLG